MNMSDYRARRKVRMSKKQVNEAEAGLAALGEELASLMRDMHASSAMVRTYRDERGKEMLACNLFTSGGTAHQAPTPQVEFRRELA